MTDLSGVAGQDSFQRIGDWANKDWGVSLRDNAVAELAQSWQMTVLGGTGEMPDGQSMFGCRPGVGLQPWCLNHYGSRSCH